MKVIECPRDAMQGVQAFIPTSLKIEYLNALLRIELDTLDFGSFVSPKAIPQMQDTAEVLRGLDLTDTTTRLLAIVANERGAQEACSHEPLTYLGFPLSLSETFQQRNTNKTIEAAFETISATQALCSRHDKQLVVYLSMGFGNPYGDPYQTEIVSEFAHRLDHMGVGIISLADTVGLATGQEIKATLRSAIEEFPQMEVGAHLHASPDTVDEKVAAVIDAGCQRLDGALRGYGGCPMAKDELIGNLPTERILEIVASEALTPAASEALQDAMALSAKVFA
ncbi:MAG: hydroxymethylglutaryl-CoA lyase [Bacteroidota bacterium]